MIDRVPPSPDAIVEIDIPVDGGYRTITRRIATVRDHADGRYTCILADPDTGILTAVTIAPATNGHWVGVEPPLSLDGAIHVARSIISGFALRRPINEQMRILSEAVLLLTGQNRPTGRPVAARVAEGQPS